MWDWLAPLLTAVATFLATSVPLYLVIVRDRRKALADGSKASVNANRQTRRDTIEEWKAVVDTLRQDRDSDRQLIHGLRNDLQDVTVRLAVCESKWEAHEKGRKEGSQ